MDHFKEYVGTLLRTHDSEKEHYRHEIELMDKYVNEVVSQFPDALSNDLFYKKTADQRLTEARALLRLTEQDSINGFVQLLMEKINAFKHWFYENNYGYIMDAHIDSEGCCKFYVIQDIHETDNQSLEESVEQKRSEGYDLCEADSEEGLVYKDSDNNKALLKKALSKFNASMFYFQSYDVTGKKKDILDLWNFSIKLPDLMIADINENRTDDCSEDTEVIDFNQMESDLNDLMLSISLFEKEKSEKMARSIIILFINLANKIGIETELVKKHNQNVEEERRKNKEIYSLNKKIASLASLNGLDKIVHEKYLNLQKEIRFNEPFYVSDFKMSIDGVVTIVLKKTHINSKKKENWVIVENDFDGKMLVDCEENLNRIANIFHNGNITSILSEFHHGTRSINQVTIQIDFQNL